MKARMPMPAKLRKQVDEAWAMEYQHASRRMVKISCLVMHTVFGFGFRRIQRFAAEINRLADESRRDPAFWDHVDKLLIDEIGLAFDREDYEQMERK